MNYSVITFDRSPQDVLTAQELAHWQRCGTTFLRLLPEGETATAYQAFDHWLGGCQKRLLIVRPDRFVIEHRTLPD